MKQNKLHIIIAEDDIDDGEIIQASFARHPSFLNVDIVKNGKELLDFLKSAKNIPDIILTDINMPILNGIEALAAIHQDSSLKNIPAFVYSTAINPSYEAKCKELGTKGFLIKPFNLEEFYEIPNRILYMLGWKD